MPRQRKLSATFRAIRVRLLFFTQFILRFFVIINTFSSSFLRMLAMCRDRCVYVLIELIKYEQSLLALLGSYFQKLLPYRILNENVNISYCIKKERKESPLFALLSLNIVVSPTPSLEIMSRFTPMWRICRTTRHIKEIYCRPLLKYYRFHLQASSCF